MSLMINQNITALNAWRNLGKTDRDMSKTMEKLSSGLRINRASDDPSGLIISEQMRAQVVGLKAAIKNSEKGISMIQTAEAALDKMHGLLDKMRGLALDSANNATADANMLAANQAEIDNIIATITRISDNTQYGTKKLLNGDNAIAGTLTAGTTGATGVAAITFAPGQEPVSIALETQVVNSTAALTDTDTTGATLVANGADGLAVDTYTLTVNGGFESFGAIDVSATTNVGSAVVSNASYTGTAGQTATFTVDGTDVNLLNVSLDGGTTTLGTIDTTGHSTDGTDNAYTFTDAGTGLTFDVTLQFGGAMTAAESFTMAVTASSATAALTDSNGAAVGSPASLNSQSTLTDVDVGGANFNLAGVDYANGVAGLTAELDVTAASTSQARLGTGAWTDAADNSTVTLTDENGNTANVTFGTVATAADGGLGSFVDNSLVFQVGANQYQTVSIAIQDVSADTLATTVANDSGFTNLAAIQIDTAAKATDAIGLIDEAIDQISVIRGDLGAFQANTLEANLDSLRVSAENLQASESVIRDTDMAAEMAQFTKYQIMLQAGTSMLAQANQMPQSILQLLQG